MPRPNLQREYLTQVDNRDRSAVADPRAIAEAGNDASVEAAGPQVKLLDAAVPVARLALLRRRCGAPEQRSAALPKAVCSTAGNHVAQHDEQSPAVRTSLLRLFRIDGLEQVAGMANLVVLSLLSPSCRLFQCAADVGLGNRFQIIVIRQRVSDEILFVVRGHTVRIRYNPGFHRLGHQVKNVVVRLLQIPTIARAQMGAWRRIYGAFSVHQQHDTGFVSVIPRLSKCSERLVAATAAYELPMPRLLARRVFEFAQERIHAPTQSVLGVAPGSAALHIDCQSTHGLAPSSPMRHRSPSR